MKPADDDLLRIVANYKAEAQLGAAYPALTKREAERWLLRCRAACDEVLQALHDAPDELQTLYSGPLSREAAEMEWEISLRLAHLPRGRRRGRAESPRERLERRVAALYVRSGERITTYDPRRYVEAGGGQGKRGGGLAQLLLAAYTLAGIAHLADLTPTLRRLQRGISTYMSATPRHEIM